MSTAADRQDWWASLKHGGVLIAPSRLTGLFSDVPEELPEWQATKLRRALNQFESDPAQLGKLMDHLLVNLAGFPADGWHKQQDISNDYAEQTLGGERLKPRRLWLGANGEELPLFVAERKRGQLESRLGIGRGKRIASRVLEWLRRRKQPLALLTNGSQWRLIHAGNDYDAWCEWDLSFWFEGGQPGPQVTAWRQLLNPAVWQQEASGTPSLLLTAVLDSRKGQAELSSVLGERVRQAVELLITASQSTIESHRADGIELDNRALYLAATRIVMRCIVLLFAEARLLLPTDNRLYQKSYSLEGLRQQLDRRAGGRASERLKQNRSAWPRLVSLFHLVYHGSSHAALLVPQYNGGLFQAGNSNSEEEVLRALAVLEQPGNTINDGHIHKLLQLITRTRIKVRQGRSATWIDAPVDFSDLSTEYIGILYEGLLDFELKQAEDNEAMLFLSIGKEPVLPLSRLEAMDDKAIKNLFKELKTKASDDSGEIEPEAEKEEPQNIDEPGNGEEAQKEEKLEEEEAHAGLMARSNEWLLRAVDVARLAKKPRGRSQRATQEYEENRQRAARKLIGRLVEPGEFYLVRWGGTRKGAGTFYTRPQLAAPTVRRTLQPLAYDPVRTEVSERTGLEEVVEWAPKTPEEILNLKVCDPAMGSGSFLASALRYLTEALLESLYYHNRLERKEDGAIARLADGHPIDHPSQQTLPVPLEHESFDEQLRARLKRHIVERCIYGVDLDPLAVELGRMALWVETMDRSLPFGFLDHKLKVGNSLVGAWLDNFRHYPVMAWLREGGDKDYQKNKPGNLINHYYEDAKGKRKGDRFTQAIKNRKGAVKEQLIAIISGQREMGDDTDIDALHGELESVFEKLHELPVHETEIRAQAYQDEVLNNPSYAALKDRLDLWCALWFWPGASVEDAPMPQNFLQVGAAGIALSREVARKHRFFHWELEFPDVFTPKRTGFDALMGNPPWEIQKPNSKEFFSNIDPFYRAYGKQEALAKQLDYFRGEAEIEHDWIAYNARLKALSNWVKYAGHPFGDRVTNNSNHKPAHDFSLGGRGANSFKQSKYLHDRWTKQRSISHGYADLNHPYTLQGGADLNTYKMFLEVFIRISTSEARIGIIVPSSIHNDLGAFSLRKTILPWLSIIVKFDNEKRIFRGLEHNSKFDVLFLDKHANLKSIKGAFFSWMDMEVMEKLDNYFVVFDDSFVEQVSPDSLSIPELRTSLDKQLLDKMYSSGILLGEDVKPLSELHMTNDSGMFKSCSDIPVYQGGMIWINDHRYNYYNEDKGVFDRGKLEDVEIRLHYPVRAKYYISKNDYFRRFRRRADKYEKIINSFRLAFRVQTSRSNQRTFISTVLPPGITTGNSLASIFMNNSSDLVFCSANFASFAHDFNVRTKVSSNVNSFYVPQFVSPHNDDVAVRRIILENSLRLIATSDRFKALYDDVCLSEGLGLGCWGVDIFAATEYERRRLQAINDSLIFNLYSLSLEEVVYLLSTFGGVDKGKELELSMQYFCTCAYQDLLKFGLDEFSNLNDGAGWSLPGTTINGKDTIAIDRVGEAVVEAYGERYFDWQLDESLPNDWRSAELAGDPCRPVGLISESDYSPNQQQCLDI